MGQCCYEHDRWHRQTQQFETEVEIALERNRSQPAERAGRKWTAVPATQCPPQHPNPDACEHDHHRNPPLDERLQRFVFRMRERVECARWMDPWKGGFERT